MDTKPHESRTMGCIAAGQQKTSRLCFKNAASLVSVTWLAIFAVACSIKPDSEKGLAGSGSSASGTGSYSGNDDVTYFAWVDLHITEANGWDGQPPGSSIEALRFKSRYSKKQFAEASLKTGINLEQYSNKAQAACTNVAEQERRTCIDLFKRMHGLCAQTVMQYRADHLGGNLRPSISCKMWVLSAGVSPKRNCMELDDSTTGQIKYLASGATVATERFVDVSLGRGTVPGDPPSCNKALSVCEAWKNEEPNQNRSCQIEGWGVYRML